MNCPKCNEPLPETGTACAHCGADVAWHVRKPDGSEYGPMDLEELERCIAEARILAGDMIRIGRESEFEAAQPILGDRLIQPPKPTSHRRQRTAAPAASKPVDYRPLAKATVGCAVVIVGILIMIFMARLPRRPSASVSSYQTACQSNLKQLGLAMYRSDHKDAFPQGADLQAAVNSYLKNASLWTCPGYTGEQGYAYNENLAGVVNDVVVDSHGTLALWDAGADVPDYSPPINATSQRHQSLDNFLFADGSVRALPNGQGQRVDPTD